MSDEEKPYRFMTSEDVAVWNKTRGLRPLSEKHWMIKAARTERLDALATGWRRLVRKQSKQIKVLQEAINDLNNEIDNVRREKKKK
jgi:hypothetical protein